MINGVMPKNLDEEITMRKAGSLVLKNGTIAAVTTFLFSGIAPNAAFMFAFVFLWANMINLGGFAVLAQDLQSTVQKVTGWWNELGN